MNRRIERVGAALARQCLKEFGSTWPDDVRERFAIAAIEALSVQNELEDDRLCFGKSFEMVTSDGYAKRIDPRVMNKGRVFDFSKRPSDGLGYLDDD